MILLFAVFSANAYELYDKVISKISDARSNYEKSNPQWLADINQAIDFANQYVNQHRPYEDGYKGIAEIGSFFLSIKNYKNALTFLNLAAFNKSLYAWCEISRMHFEGLGFPKDIDKGNEYLEKGLTYCEGVPCGDLYFITLQGYYKFPIDYDIKRLPNPQNNFKNFEDSGFTFNIKNSKEFLFMYEEKDKWEHVEHLLPLSLTKEQLEKAKDRPSLVPEAYVARLFSDYKESGSDIEQLVDIEIVKQKTKILRRCASEVDMRSMVEENTEWTEEFYYRYVGELSNGLQIVSCINYGGGSAYPPLRLAAFSAKKRENSKIDIDMEFRIVPPDRPYSSRFYIEYDTLIERKYDNSLNFYTYLPVEEFKKTKLPILLKYIENKRRNKTGEVINTSTQLVDWTP